MIASALLSLALLAASSFIPVARAGSPYPTEPVKGDVYNSGSKCRIAWKGDETSDTMWKGMSIQLMTGPNLNMVQLINVATDQDGTVDGTFSYECPEVTFNAPIYFYRFTSPGSAGNPNFSTRFTIASSTGKVEDAPTQIQPGSNEAIPWGTGAIVQSGKTGSTKVSPSKTSASATWTGTRKGDTTTPTSKPTSTTRSSSRHDSGRGTKTITTTATATATATVATQTKTVTVWPATITTTTATIWPSSITTVTVWPSSLTTTVTVRPSLTQTVTVWSPVQTVTATTVSTKTVDKPVTVTIVEDHATTVMTTTTSAELRMITVTTSSPSETDTADDEVETSARLNRPKNAATAGFVFDFRLATVVAVLMVTFML